jgi:hypothetical protein
MKKLVTIFAVVTMTLILSGAAQATPIQASILTFTLVESGSNVVGTVSGTLNTVALTMGNNSSNTAMLCASVGAIIVGPDQYQRGWTGFASTTSSFGTSSFLPANTATGDTVGLSFANKALYVSPSYVSGSVLSGNATWNGNTFASLGITPGTYTMTYNGGADSVVLQVGAIPEPATIAILGLGGLLLRRKK